MMSDSRKSRRMTLVAATAAMVIVATISPASAFTPAVSSSTRATQTVTSPSLSSLHYKHKDNEDDCNNQFDKDDCDILKERLNTLKVNVLEEELRRPPNNPDLKPQELVKAIMDGLLHSYDPLPDSGFRMLLHASTKSWRYKILQSIGVPMKKKMMMNKDGEINSMNIDLIASALGEAMGRPENQFAILVGEEEEYVLDFPSDPLEYDEDGTCWVECKLRNKSDGKLLVITGWELLRQAAGEGGEGPWLVDNIMWQDFRDKYRPGIGREEWTRICR